MPAEPVKPVSQASRSSDGATYSFCCWPARGTTKPVSRRRASSSRNADSRAASATPVSGSSNVWNWASNMALILGSRHDVCNAAQNVSHRERIVLGLLHLHQAGGNDRRYRPFTRTIPPGEIPGVLQLN